MTFLEELPRLGPLSLLPPTAAWILLASVGLLLGIAVLALIVRAFRRKPADPVHRRRRTTWEFTVESVAETWEAALLIVEHAALICVALLCANGVERLHHALADPHAVPTMGSKLFDFGIQAAEGILVPGLLLIGTASALWTFAQRRKE